MFEKSHRPHFRPAKILFFIVAAILFLIVIGGIVMLLWNAILPDLTGVRQIKWWEAMGILALSRILFGSFHLGKKAKRGGPGPKSFWANKWRNMSNEERAEFKERWKERCRSKGD